MKVIKPVLFISVVAALSGCMSASKVQNMIDASYQDQTSRIDAHEGSIDVLKQSAVAGLEKSKENAVLIEQMQTDLTSLEEQVRVNKGFAEASKVMSAANTVKVAELDEMLEANIASDTETKQLLMQFDKLYEGVMIAHYQMIADSATAAVESLKADGWVGSTNAPVNLEEPIEITAPEAAPTNAPVVDAAE